MAVAVVGLTGGIAAGKSTVARAFGAHGVPTVDADQLAREVVAWGSDGLAEIVAHFGEQVLLPGGTLDRKALGAIVFQDAQARARLNAITHPRIARLAAERIAAHGETGVPYVLYEAALLVESGSYRAMSALVVVKADVPTQLARLRERDLLSEAEAEARVASQAPLEHKLAVADFVIDNSQTTEDLADQVENVHARLLERVRVKGP